MRQAGANWTEEELTLAYAVYLEYSGERLTKAHPAISELSQLLREAPINLDWPRDSSYRPVDGVRSRVGNFRRLDGGDRKNVPQATIRVWEKYNQNHAHLLKTKSKIIESWQSDRQFDMQLSEELTLGELRSLAVKSASSKATPNQRTAHYLSRSAAIKSYTLKRANGACENCAEKAPFVSAAGQPYLEVHNIKHLAAGRPNDPERVIALCPNCHREAHYSGNAQAFNSSLAAKVLEKEKAIISP